MALGGVRERDKGIPVGVKWCQKSKGMPLSVTMASGGVGRRPMVVWESGSERRERAR